MSRIPIACAAVLCSAHGLAVAGISTYTSGASLMADVTGFSDFNTLSDGQSLMGYQEGGLVTSVNRSYYSWDAPGLDGSEMFYASTGSLELTSISRENGDDFQDLDMQISSGWTPDSIGTVYLWIQLYDNGNLVFEDNLNAQSGEYVGIVGGGFDQVLIGSYASESVRDSRNPNARNAIAIDNLSAGTFVPTPGTGLLFAFAASIGVRRRR